MEAHAREDRFLLGLGDPMEDELAHDELGLRRRREGQAEERGRDPEGEPEVHPRMLAPAARGEPRLRWGDPVEADRLPVARGAVAVGQVNLSGAYAITVGE
jgi:hypothetical protein